MDLEIYSGFQRGVDFVHYMDIGGYTLLDIMYKLVTESTFGVWITTKAGFVIKLFKYNFS